MLSFWRLHFKAIIGSVVTVGVLAGLLTFFYLQDVQQRKTVITTGTIKEAGVGRISRGKNDSLQPAKLQTSSQLEFQSKELATNNPTTTAAVVKWQQAGGEEGVEVSLRTFDGKDWSPWIESGDSSERPDTAAVDHSAIIVSKDVQKVQYRFNLEATDQTSSPEIDLGQTTIETIDTSRGPSIDKKTTWQRLGSGMAAIQSVFNGKAFARPAGPAILSRLAWGSPEPYGSPRWPAEYQALHRVIVHHTATTNTADSAAAVRAIWEFHANGHGWGDIGYNYLVDRNGNIFQGRWFDGNYAEANNVDVVGGHTYGNNYGTTGIAALGDFTNSQPTTGLIHYIGEVAAYKGGPYNLNPAASTTPGGNLIGHRDAGSTACPGATLYPKLQQIRDIAGALFPKYQVRPFAWQYVNQYVYTDSARQNPVDPTQVKFTTGQKLYLKLEARNTGSQTWQQAGSNPVRLGTSNPNDRASPFCDTDTWLNCGRAASLNESQVAPGQTGTFLFSVVVPANPNIDRVTLYGEYFNLVAEGNSWMPDPGLVYGFMIERPYAWEYVNQYAYSDSNRQTPINLLTTPLDPGDEVYFTVQARNVGSLSWPASGANAVRLGTSNARDRISAFCNNTWLNCVRPSTVNAVTAPGEIGNFYFKVTAPANNTGSVKTYNEYYNLLSEQKVWMNDPGLYSTIKVNPN